VIVGQSMTAVRGPATFSIQTGKPNSLFEQIILTAKL